LTKVDDKAENYCIPEFSNKTRMKHVFRFDSKWGLELQRRAPHLGRCRGLVRENKQICTDGGFDLASGERVVVAVPPPTKRIVPPLDPAAADAEPNFPTTVVTVSLLDTLSGALFIGENAAALNFANAFSHGGGYKHGAQAQEEDLCRLLPQLIHSLEYVKYPILQEEGECLVTRDLMAVREVGTYEPCKCQGLVNMLTSAMPCGDAGRPGCQRWNDTVTLRIRGVLHAARVSGFTKLVLGAWGCGAFGNPPDLVSKIFRTQLSSPEFRGAFSHVVFAIVDPRGDGNYQPFFDEISQMDESEIDPPAAAEGGAEEKEKEAEGEDREKEGEGQS